MVDTLLVYASRSAITDNAGVGLGVSVDGINVGSSSVTTVTGTGAQKFSFTGDFGTGSHTVAVSFFPGTHSQSLNVEAIIFNGQTYAGEYGANNADNGSGFIGSGPDSDPIAAEMYTFGSLTFTGLVGSATPGQFYYGSPSDDTIVGGPGDDIIRGNAGNDTLDGGPGDDILFGGLGHDVLFGGAGRDTFIEKPGDGSDTVHFQVGVGGDIVNLAGYGYTGFDDVRAHMIALTGGGTLLQHPNGETTLFLNDASESIRDVTPGNFVPDNFRFNISDAPPIYGPRSTLVVHVREDAWNGDAAFTLDVDGVQIAGPTFDSTTTASRYRDFTYINDFGAGPHTVAVHFINDAYGGSSTTDRNLYVGGITFDGVTYAGQNALNDARNGQPDADPNSAEMYVNGTVTFQNVGSITPPPPPTDSLVLHVSEDAWNGDAQFAVLVDGTQVGGVQTATASHGIGLVQDITLTGDFSAAPHSVEVRFLNDAWGGTAATDRNLYVEGITFNGTAYAGQAAFNNAQNGQPDADPNAAEMYINGSVIYGNVDGSSPPPPTTSTVVLHLSEDAWNGDAQFVVSVDGVQQGAARTVTASHGAAQVQDITISGDFGTQGPGTIDLTFLNDAWGGSAATDRNLYVQSIDVNGVHFQGNTAANNAANGGEASDLSAAVMDINGTATFHVNHTAPPEIMG